MDVVGRCQAPGCQRSARAVVSVEGAPTPIEGLTCPRHATQTELGALLHGWSATRKR